MIKSKRLISSVALTIIVACLIALNIFAQDSQATENSAEIASETVWEASDFTYCNVNELKSGDSDDSAASYPDGFLIYGCDYSRQFYINGKVVTGFSSAGEEKLKTNKDLVIPRCDEEGNTLVGVGPKAFQNKGLTSVKFPTGMKTDYVDKTTKYVTKRGNFVIFPCAFEKNNLTEVNLPDGVLACMEIAFRYNNIKKVTIPRTMWWIETEAFAHNQITDVIFPQTTDFQMEMHGMPFGDNQIKAVRLPDFTAVVNKHSFHWNTGNEKVSDDCPIDACKTHDGVACGVVYMYTDNASLSTLDRIHTTDKTTTSTKSWEQKLITKYNAFTSSTQWTMNDFTYAEDKTTFTAKITGLSSSGIAKRKVNTDLAIPEQTPNGYDVTEIASSSNISGGLFATSTEKLTSVTLSTKVRKVGENAFRGAGLSDVALNNALVEIGNNAFQNNNLTSVVMSDTVTTVGSYAFANNPTLESINFSSSLTEIPEGCFSCESDSSAMENLKTLELRDCVTKIEKRAFKGNNFSEIEIPSNVKEIGEEAFATSASLNSSCTLELNDGLKTISGKAFKNKNVDKIDLPMTVRALPVDVFIKDSTPSSKVKVYVTNQVQVNNVTDFPASDYHEVILVTEGVWLSGDFTYSQAKSDSSKYVITGLSESGKTKASTLKDLVTPAINSDFDSFDKIKHIDGIEASAFSGTSFETVRIETIDASLFDSSASNTSTYQIFDSAFENCSIKTVTLPENLTKLGTSAFASNSLTEITLPEGLSTIGKLVFENNAFEKVSIPKTVKTISESAFKNSKGLANYLNEIELTDGIEKIESEAFAGCSCTETELPTTVTSLSVDAFGKTKVQDVNVLTRNTDISDGKVSGVKVSGSNYHITYSKLATTGWKASDFKYGIDNSMLNGFSESGKAKRGVLTELILPDFAPDGTKITSIDGYVEPTSDKGVVVDPGEPLFGCPVSEVSFGKADEGRDDEDDEIIEEGVVNSPYGFSSVSLPAYLTKIDKCAFRYNNMTSVEFPDTLKTIGSEAFKGNKLTSLNLSDNVETCGDGCFATNNITQARLSSKLKEIPSGFMSYNIRLTNITIPDAVTKIGQSAFAGARLTSLTIPKNVTYIGVKAFHLHHLTELTIPGNVKEIADNAFEGTYKAQTLSKLTIEDGVEIIGSGAFKEGLLTQVEFPTSVKTLGEKVFENNTGVDPAKGDNRVKIYVRSKSQVNLVQEASKETEYVVLLCTVKFDSRLGSDVAEQTVESGNKATKPVNPTRSGYVFDNWYVDKNYSKVFDFNTAITQDLTLYAKWTAQETPVERVTMWRLYNKWTGEHFYTSNADEQKNLVKVGWTDEGIGWYAPKKTSSPIYRLYNPYVEGGDHHYTLSATERDNCVKAGWSYEGEGWYSLSASDTGAKPLYRQYNPYALTGTHNYTLSKTENDKVIKAGWRAEGVGWYGYDSAK